MNRRDSFKPATRPDSFVLSLKRAAHAPEMELAREEIDPGEQPRPVDRQAIDERIRELEAQLREQPGGFSWSIHNELRQLYLGINERKSMEHADAILAQLVMDAHVLNALSDWQMDSTPRHDNPGLAIVALLDRAGRYPDLSCLGVACLIKAGDLHAALNRSKEAQRLYRWALSLAMNPTQRSLEPYLMLARSRLDTFRL